jgi:hypothetical protein
VLEGLRSQRLIGNTVGGRRIGVGYTTNGALLSVVQRSMWAHLCRILATRSSPISEVTSADIRVHPPRHNYLTWVILKAQREQSRGRSQSAHPIRGRDPRLTSGIEEGATRQVRICRLS